MNKLIKLKGIFQGPSIPINKVPNGAALPNYITKLDDI